MSLIDPNSDAHLVSKHFMTEHSVKVTIVFLMYGSTRVRNM